MKNIHMLPNEIQNTIFFTCWQSIHSHQHLKNIDVKEARNNKMLMFVNYKDFVRRFYLEQREHNLQSDYIEDCVIT